MPFVVGKKAEAPDGTAVRFEPGEEKELLVELEPQPPATSTR